MMKKLALAMFCSFLFPAISQAAAAPALAGHNAAHKVEKLVTLRQLDENFQNQFYSVQVQVLTPGAPGTPAFRAVVSQVPDASGQARQVELFLDSKAKALTFKDLGGPASVNAPRWPEADALRLAEDSMHYLVDNGKENAELAPFYNGFASLTLTPAQDASGNPLARAQVKANGTQAVLDIFVKLDGAFVSYKVTK